MVPSISTSGRTVAPLIGLRLDVGRAASGLGLTSDCVTTHRHGFRSLRLRRQNHWPCLSVVVPHDNAGSPCASILSTARSILFRIRQTSFAVLLHTRGTQWDLSVEEVRTTTIRCAAYDVGIRDNYHPVNNDPDPILAILRTAHPCFPAIILHWSGSDASTSTTLGDTVPLKPLPNC